MGEQEKATKFEALFGMLMRPFRDDEVKIRTQAGRQLHYVTSRTVMNRLDEELGPENWWDEYVPLQHSVLCKLTIRLPDGSLLTKSDAGGYAGMQDQGDDDKSGFADALKRAAVKFGIGRYLYRDGVPMFARPGFRGNALGDAQRDDRPQAPPPSQESSGGYQPQPSRPQASGNGYGDDAPRSGRALFSWAKKRGEALGSEWMIVDQLNEWAKSRNLPKRMTEWTDQDAQDGYAFVAGSANAPQQGRQPAMAGAPSGPPAYKDDDVPY